MNSNSKNKTDANERVDFIHKKSEAKNPINIAKIDDYREKFMGNKNLVMARDMVNNFGIQKVATLHQYKMQNENHFSNTVDACNVAHQKQSGRCWIFAMSNVMRIAFIKKHNLSPDFEFSQSYIFFYSLLEKANFFLDEVIKYKDKPIKSREMYELLESPISDGGYWIDFINLYNKYGIVPKEIMPDSKSAINTSDMSSDLKCLLRKSALILRKMADNGATDIVLKQAKTPILKEVYKILSVNLGIPPKKFDWQYEDKSGKVHNINNCTPKDFAKEYVPYNTEDYISISNNKLEIYPNYTLYRIPDEEYVTSGWPHTSITVPLDTIKKAVMDSIMAGVPVSFSQQVTRGNDLENGVLDESKFDKSRLYQTDIMLSHKDGLKIHDIVAEHGMMITGFHKPEGKEMPTKWQVQNSWGTDSGKKGYLVMTDEWFDKYAFRFNINKKFLPEEVIKHCFDNPKIFTKLDNGL